MLTRAPRMYCDIHVCTQPYCCLFSLSLPLSLIFSCMCKLVLSIIFPHAPHTQHSTLCALSHAAPHHISRHHTLHTPAHILCTCNNHCNFIQVHMISTNTAMPLVISMRPPHAHMHVSTLTQALTSPPSHMHTHTHENTIYRRYILTYTKYTHTPYNKYVHKIHVISELEHARFFVFVEFSRDLSRFVNVPFPVSST